MVFEAEHQTMGKSYFSQVSLEDWLASGHREHGGILDERRDTSRKRIAYLHEVLSNLIQHMHSVKPFTIEELSSILAGDRGRKIVGILPTYDWSKTY